MLDGTLERIVADLVDRMDRRYFGKYRGLVVRNDDPENLGRLTVRVPGILGEDVVTGWALPCMPAGGEPNQGFLALPGPGAGVWVEFEEGDLEFPIWTGAYWTKPGGESEIPRANNRDGQEYEDGPTPATRKIFKTARGHTIQFEDAAGQETVLIVEATHGHVIALDKDGIKIGQAGGKQEILLEGDTITLRGPGIRIGGAGGEPLVLGDTLAGLLKEFVTGLKSHTHLGNMGAPTGPPVPTIAPLEAKINTILSKKHKIEDAGDTAH